MCKNYAALIHLRNREPKTVALINLIKVSFLYALVISMAICLIMIVCRCTEMRISVQPQTIIIFKMRTPGHLTFKRYVLTFQRC